MVHVVSLEKILAESKGCTGKWRDHLNAAGTMYAFLSCRRVGLSLSLSLSLSLCVCVRETDQTWLAHASTPPLRSCLCVFPLQKMKATVASSASSSSNRSCLPVIGKVQTHVGISVPTAAASARGERQRCTVCRPQIRNN